MLDMLHGLQEGEVLRIEEGQHFPTLCSVAPDECTQIDAQSVLHKRGSSKSLIAASTSGREDEDDGVVSGSETDDEDRFSEIAEHSPTEVVYVKEGVAVWPTRTERIEGRLSLVKQHQVLFLAWLPYSRGTLREDGSFEVTPVAARSCGSSSEQQGASTGNGPSSAAHPSSADRTMYAIHPMPLYDIKALRTHTPRLGWHWVALTLVSGVTLPPLYFHRGGVRALISALMEHAFLVRCLSDPNTLLVNDVADPLQRSLTSLELADVMIGAPPAGSSFTFAPPAPGATAATHPTASAPPTAQAAAVQLAQGAARGQQQQGDPAARSPAPLQMRSLQPAAVASAVPAAAGSAASAGISARRGAACCSSGGGGRGSSDDATVLFQPPGSPALHDAPWKGLAEGLTRLVKDYSGAASQWLAAGLAAGCEGQGAGCELACDCVLPPWADCPGGSGSCGSARAAVAAAAAGGSSAPVRPASAPPPALRLGGTGSSSSGSSVAAATAASGSSNNLPSSSSGASAPPSPNLLHTGLGDFELVHSCDLVDAAGVMGGGAHARAPPPPLSLEEWQAMFDAEGRLVSPAALKARVFTSGVDPAVRRECWKYLLGVHAWDSTAAERAAATRRRRSDYNALRQQWQSISEVQAARFGAWRERKSRVDKDVRRTDRSHPFFAEERGPHARALRQVLLTHCMYNFDLGYCQGMSDLAAPLLLVMRGDEAETFWAFAALMGRLAANFDEDQQGMHAQLLALSKLMRLLDPQLHAFLEARDCLSYIYCFRWLLVHFKREFKYDDVLRLWEAAWSCPVTPHLHIYMCAAVLVHHRRAIMHTQELEFDGLVRFCVQLSGKLELEPLLRTATQLASFAGRAGAELLEGLPVSCQR